MSSGIYFALQHILDPCCVICSGVLTEFKQEIARITSFTISNNLVHQASGLLQILFQWWVGRSLTTVYIVGFTFATCEAL